MKLRNLGTLLVFSTIFATTWGRASVAHEALQAALGVVSVSNCVLSLTEATRKLDSMTPQDYLDEFSRVSELRADLWADKLALHEKLRAFHSQATLAPECANAFRATLRAVRTIEDYAQDYQFRNNPTQVPFPDNAWAKDNVHVLRSPRFSDFDLNADLETGDVILTRGNAYSSTAISQLGEFDTQFSHISIVYKDERGRLWTVESHIEVGSFVRPLKDHIADSNRRVLVLRPSDRELARKAGEMIFKKVRDHSRRRGNIRYDFGFSMADSRQLFCSELVSHAFELASNGEVKIPFVQSRLMTRKQGFVRLLEITAEQSFIPADIEIDPRFEIVAEWRDAGRMQDTFEKDALMQSVYDWNDRLHYTLIQGSNGKSRLYRNLVWPLRRIPILKIPFREKLPLNMSRRLIGYFGVLEGVGELLQRKLQQENARVVESRGLPLFASEARALLETYRAEDAVATRRRLHRMYRPLRARH